MAMHRSGLTLLLLSFLIPPAALGDPPRVYPFCPVIGLNVCRDTLWGKKDFTVFLDALGTASADPSGALPSPPPTRAGVDLPWHLDRAVDYIANTIDHRRDGIPLYAQWVYTMPARLEHAQWDVPHCVGRYLHVLTRWEQVFGRALPEQETLLLLRELLHQSISPQDHFAHFPAYCRATHEADMHSQREVLLALVGLARQHGDQKSLTLARELVGAYVDFVHAPAYSPNPMVDGRFLEALLDYHRLTADPAALALMQKLADTYYQYFNDAGDFPMPAHNHSVLGTITNLIEFGIYTGQGRYLEKMKKVLDNGVWKIRSSYGLVFEGPGPRGEANCTGDLVRAELLLALHGYPEYFDDVERIVRNHLLASQYLTVGPVPPGTAAPPPDSNTVIYRRAATRALGGFAFTLPNDLVDPNYPELAADLVEGASNALFDVYNSIVTRDADGLHVNLLFSTVTPDLELRSYLPARGLVELTTKKPANLYVHLPAWLDPNQICLTLDGQRSVPRRVGSFLFLARVASPSTVRLEFAQPRRVETETIAGATYEVTWQGDTVWLIRPQGTCLPLYHPGRLVFYGATR
jgi:hypothetical protein